MNVRQNTHALLLLLLLAPAAAHVNLRTQAAFEEVYRTRRWEPRKIVRWEGKQGGGSGTGSSVEFTVPLRRLLQQFVADYSIRSMVDVPCGAMVWQAKFLEHVRSRDPAFRFHGMEIVRNVVNANRERFAGDPNVTFEVADMANDPVPPGYDLVFSRDALQHNSFTNIVQALRQWSRSTAKFLLVGTHPRGVNRRSTLSGYNFFHLNLDSPPFSMPAPLANLTETTSNWLGEPSAIPKHLYLYSMRQLQAVNYEAMMRRAAKAGRA